MYDESCILVIKTSHANRIKIAVIFSTYIAIYNTRQQNHKRRYRNCSGVYF